MSQASFEIGLPGSSQTLRSPLGHRKRSRAARHASYENENEVQNENLSTGCLQVRVEVSFFVGPLPKPSASMDTWLPPADKG